MRRFRRAVHGATAVTDNGGLVDPLMRPQISAMEAPTVTSPAARSRRYRERQRAGWFVLQVNVHQEYVDALVDHSFLAEGDADHREKVAEAVDLFLFYLSEGAIEIDRDHFA